MQAPIDLTAEPDHELSPGPHNIDHSDQHIPSHNPRPSTENAIDVLYEHQRGSWFCGLPLYSSASLLNFDPAAWCNAQGHASPVDVTNAPTPDPSWTWAWPTWYVDMSGDVDEDGWQYSFMFRRKAVWHGTHPWLFSFVRRRRWTRMRTRHKASERRVVEEAHRMNEDYFTIHPAKTIASERRSSYALSLAQTATTKELFNVRSAEVADEPTDIIENTQTLLRLLRVARVDREKINLVLQFLEQGGDDVYYLAEHMSHILSLFVFQYARRQLLARMLQKINEAREHRVEHQRRQEAESAQEKQKIDNLLRAIKAAEEEVKALEYWSDIRDVVQKGETVSAADEGSGWDHGWQGVDQSGAKQAKAPATDEQGRIEHGETQSAGSAT